MSTVRAGQSEQSGPAAIPALFAHLVDDTTLLLPKKAIPSMSEVATRYLSARAGDYGGMSGQLVCPVSRLSELVAELAKLSPSDPVDISLVVDTGLGAVPKALSMVLSRETLLTPCTVETAAPSDLDSTWLERVSEFVPEDVLAVIEPRRPLEGDTKAWLDAVRRVADHGSTPKLRCGGPRASDVPTLDEVADFVTAADAAPAGFTTSLGLRYAVRQRDESTGQVEHGLLNMVVAVGRALVSGDVRAALAENDGTVLAREVGKLSEAAAGAVRGLLTRCGCGSAPASASELVRFGLL